MKIRKPVNVVALGLALLLAGPVWAQTEDIYVSATGSGTAGDISFEDEDIVLCDGSGGAGTCIWSMFFDGSAAGLGKEVDTNAFHVLDDDNVLMSFRTPKKIGNLNKVDDSDIVHYDRTDGPNGSFEFYFDGSEVGLSNGDEAIDAIGFTPSGGGRLVISTDGDYSVPRTGGGTLNGGDEDLIVFNGTTGPDGTSGDWELFFDGSSVGLNSPQEDIGGAWIDDVTDELYLTARGAFSLGSITGGGADIFVCDPLDFDPTTACTMVSGYFFAADENFDGKVIDGLFIVNNSGPIAVDDFFTTDEGTAISGANVLAANPTTPDSDPDGDPLTVTEVDGNPANVGIEIALASGALLTVLADGNMTYDPNGQFEGLGGGQTAEDGFGYTIDDGNGLSDSATVTITILGVDDPPVAIDDLATLIEDDPATLLDVLANDTDIDGGPKTVNSVGDPAGGTVVNFGTHVTYEPDPDFCNDGSPTDDFTYTLNGGSTATVYVTVTCVEDPPVAVDDLATLNEGDPATLLDVLANDTDVDDGPKTVDSVTQPPGGTVVNFGTHVTYEPDPDFCNDGSPTDDFTYTLNGGSTATVYMTVICVPDPPVVTPPGPFDAIGNVRIQVPDGADDLLSNVGGDAPFTISSATATSANSAVVNVFIDTSTGAFSYDPPVGFEGSDSFDYEVCNPGGCDTGTVSLSVSGMIWFVDVTAGGGGDGRLTSPFNCLSGAGCFDPTAADDAGDNIFLADGAYTGGLALLDNQRLIGDGSSSDLATITGITVPTYSDSLPVFSGTDPVITSAANGINLASGNTIRGLMVGDVGGTGFHGTTVGSLTITETSIGDATPSGGGIEVTTSGSLSVALDSLSADSATDEGIHLNGVSGTFSITDTAGVIATTAVPAIDIDGNPSLAVTMTFASVSANGGSSGIDLTDVTGSFTVTGDGSTPASGGTIQNMWWTGIHLENAENISLNWMQIDNAADAIRGSDVNNFTLWDSVVNGPYPNDCCVFGGVRFDNLTGTASITNSTIEGGLEDNIRIDNSAATLSMTVDTATIGLNHTTLGNDGILLQTTGTAEVDLTIMDSVFLGARGDMVQTNALGNSIQIITIENCSFDNTHPNIVSGGGGITLSGGSATSNIDVDYTVTGNTFSGADGNAITANFLSNLGMVAGVIENNTIGTAAPGSGSLSGSGIFLGAEKTGAVSGGDLVHTVLIDNNTIRAIDGFAGINVGSSGGDASNRAEVNATVTNNDVAGLGGFALSAMYLLAGGSAVSGDFAHICADVQNNVALDASAGPSAGNAVYFDQISADANYNLPGYAGSPIGEFNGGTASFDIDAHLNALSNSMTNGPLPTFPGGVDAGLVLGVTGGASCPTP